MTPKNPYRVVTADKQPGLPEENSRVAVLAWPEFMLHDPVADYFTELHDRFPGHQFGLTDAARYIQWQTDEGLPFGPWLRVHVRLGGEIVKVCPRAMRITGSVAQWEEWTGMRFPESGKYVVPGGLIPVEIDCEKDRGLYVEPNVWMGHPIR